MFTQKVKKEKEISLNVTFDDWSYEKIVPTFKTDGWNISINKTHVLFLAWNFSWN